MTEADLQAAVVECARLFGWRVAHFRPALTKRGWRTPVAADGAGFPDLLMLRQDRILVAELKAAKGRVGEAQYAWLDAFATAIGDANVHVWRPDDWLAGEVERVLAPAAVRGAA